MNSTENCSSLAERRRARLAVGLIAEDPRLADRTIQALDACGVGYRARVGTPDALARVDPPLDVVLLDAGSDLNALLNAIRDARQAFPDTKLVAVWPMEHAGESRRALRAGADGLVSDEDLERMLEPTLAAISSGVVCVPRAMRAPLESESLSMREKQVLGMIVMGFTNAEIAAKLYVAESTVKSHLSSAYAKLGVRSRKDAATRVLDPAEGLGPGILAISAV